MNVWEKPPTKHYSSSSGFRKSFERKRSITSREHAGMCGQRSFSGDIGAPLQRSVPESMLGFQDLVKDTTNYMVGCSVIPNEKTVELIFHECGSIIKYVKTHRLA